MTKSTRPDMEHLPSEPSAVLEAALRPITIAGRTARNRLVCSPMSTNMASRDGSVSSDLLDFYSVMADSGVGLVGIGGSSVSEEGACSANGMHAGRKDLEPGLHALAKTIANRGALSALQLMHAGAQGNTRYTGQPVLGPSPYIEPNIKIEARQLTVEEIHRIEWEFAQAIVQALGCGFDFVELHIAHGYLLHEFMSPFFNRRQDEYGGTVENRLRIFRNIMERADRMAPGSLRRIGARISGEDFQPDGLNIERNDPLIGLFNGYGTAYWVVSAGVYETAVKKYPAMREGLYWRLACELRKKTPAPVIAQGGVRTIEQAARIIATGQGDMVGMAQALLADPKILLKTVAGRADTVAPCIECGRCKYLKRTDLTFDCLVEDGYHPPNMAALARRVSPEAIAKETPDKALDLPKRRRVHPVGHI